MVDLKSLKPYQSFLLLKIRLDHDETRSVALVIDDLVQVLEDNEDGSETTIVEVKKSFRSNELQIGTVHYVQRLSPSWYSSNEIEDLANHLILVARNSQHIAIYSSESGISKTIRLGILSRVKPGFASLEFIPSGILHAAFLTGSTRTLWLSGAHRRTSAKADNKILTGLDLRDALDPLGDQSYHFTAARSKANIAGEEFSIGVTPRKSKVWLGPSHNWREFIGELANLLRHLEAVLEPLERPIPIVAAASGNFQELEGPFDISIAPWQLLADNPPGEVDNLALLENWAENSSFDNIQLAPGGEPNHMAITADLLLKQVLLGSFTLDVTRDDLGNLTFLVTGLPASLEVQENFEIGLSLIRSKESTKVWFESGHTLSHGAIYELIHRDIPFERFAWGNMTGYNIGKEKPNNQNLSNIGKEDSLFDWVKNHWPDMEGKAKSTGWLTCNDGSMEIADFIHVDTSKEKSLLTLIHIKHSSSSKANRQVSVSDFEVVTSQAVKNLRHLDQLLIAEAFEQTMEKKVGKLVWKDGALIKKEEFLSTLGELGADYDRNVVIVQPRIREESLKRARRGKNSQEYKRLRQLDTLLHGAASACRDLGAQLWIIGAAE